MHRRQFFALAGCGTLALGFGTTARSDERSAAGVIERYLAAWNLHDSQQVAMFLDKDVFYFDASVGTLLYGRQAAIDGIVENFMNAAPDCRWELTSPPFAQGEQVSFWWNFSGTNTGAWADGTPPTGRSFAFSGRSFAKICNDRICYQADYYDASELYR